MKSIFVLLLVTTSCAFAQNGNHRFMYNTNIKEKIHNALNAQASKNQLEKNLRNGKHVRIPYDGPPKDDDYATLNEEIEKIELMRESESEYPQQIMNDNAAKTASEKLGIYIKKNGKALKHPAHPTGMKAEMTQFQPLSEEEKNQEICTTFAYTPFDRNFFSTTVSSQLDKRTTKQEDKKRPKPIQPKTNDENLDDLKKAFYSNSDNENTRTLNFEDLTIGSAVFLVVLMIGFIAAIAVPAFVIGCGVYRYFKRSQNRRRVEYPPYGVTGPSEDSYGDRSLAQSAQLFHFHHQKQQITMMEGYPIQLRNGSVSDPDSDDNEEGHYTVFECPGLATTGQMEVRNPLFDEATPFTPGTVQVVPQVTPGTVQLVQSQLKE